MGINRNVLTEIWRHILNIIMGDLKSRTLEYQSKHVMLCRSTQWILNYLWPVLITALSQENSKATTKSIPEDCEEHVAMYE